MLDFLKKEVNIYSPVKGKVVDLEVVPDEMFSRKMLGDGVAIEIHDNIICSPVKGTIRALFPTKHAFLVETKEGVEVLVHIGLDTVDLKGEGFDSLADIDDKVKAGEPVIKVNRELVKEKGFNLITMVIVTNIDKIKNIEVVGNGESNLGDKIVRCKF
ncbi:MAG: PTS glucose transporter subunit IIA [Clostridiaceae bacterium]